MFQRQLNHLALRFALVPRDPLLIKSGLESADPTRPGMEFVRTRHPAVGETIYLPGTSLKGAVRSHAERVLRGLGVASVCDPLVRKRDRPPGPHDAPLSCGGERGGTRVTHAVFAGQCPICRTFGSLGVAGRCGLYDAYPWPPEADDAGKRSAAAVANLTERRVQVGIDRETGGTARGTLYDLEVAAAGAFHTELHLDNFQLWQLGLLAATLDDIDAGDVPIGFGKSRGLGQMSVVLGALTCTWVGDVGQHMRGVGDLCRAQERSDYLLEDGDHMPWPAGCTPQRTWRGQRLLLTGDGLRALLVSARTGPLVTFLNRRATVAR